MRQHGAATVRRREVKRAEAFAASSVEPTRTLLTAAGILFTHSEVLRVRTMISGSTLVRSCWCAPTFRLLGRGVF